MGAFQTEGFNNPTRMSELRSDSARASKTPTANSFEQHEQTETNQSQTDPKLKVSHNDPGDQEHCSQNTPNHSALKAQVPTEKPLHTWNVLAYRSPRAKSSMGLNHNNSSPDHAASRSAFDGNWPKFGEFLSRFLNFARRSAVSSAEYSRLTKPRNPCCSSSPVMFLGRKLISNSVHNSHAFSRSNRPSLFKR